MHIKTIMLTSAFLAIIQNAALAQKLTVENMTAAPMDLSASQYERKDLADQPCGLVKVQLATMGAKFEGNIVGKTDYKTGEYWVYMSQGSYMLTVKHPNFVPLKVNFRDHGIVKIEGKRTYILTLQMPQTRDAVQKQKLIIKYSPTSAMVIVDSKVYRGNGQIELELPVGDHNYTIAEDGYNSIDGIARLNAVSPRTITESLVRAVAAQAPLDDTQYSQKESSEIITVNGVSFKMVLVEGGTFMMGATLEQGSDASDDEKPAHEVTLATYSIGETEVTQELWQAVMGSNPSRFKGSNQPVEKVSWYDSQTFIQKLNQLTGRHFRLPTEAEWEYAARGGSKSRGYKYSGSNNINEVAWYSKTTDDKGSRNVKTKKANELGLYDMSGNVYEWCQGVKDNYISNPEPNPSGPTSGYHRVCRGGSWGHLAGYCRVSDRSMDVSASKSSFIGLRLAL